MAMLELYLIRHGIAADADPDAEQPDALRPLTKKGVARLQREAAGLDALGVSFSVIITSPLARARETADVLARAMKARAPVVVSQALAPTGSPAAVLAELAERARRPRMALVGHEPALGELASRLLRGRAGSAAIAFQKGGVCRIDVDGIPPTGPAALRWLVTPKMLRRLGRR